MVDVSILHPTFCPFVAYSTKYVKGVFGIFFIFKIKIKNKKKE